MYGNIMPLSVAMWLEETNAPIPGPVPPGPKPDIHDIPDYTMRFRFGTGYDPESLDITGGEWTHNEEMSKYYGNVWDWDGESVPSWAELYYRIDSSCLVGVGKVSKPVYALPPHTLRIRFDDATYDPTEFGSPKLVWTKVSDGLFDIYCEDTSWEDLLNGFLYNEFHMDEPDLTTHFSIVDAGDISDVTSLARAFRRCDGLDSICWMNTSSVTDMTSAFAGALGIARLPVWPTGNVTSMKGLFNAYTNAGHPDDAMSLEHMPLLDTANVTDFSNLFQVCPKLTSVPLFDTARGVNMNSMFAGCSSLETIPQFCTSSCTTMKQMFSMFATATNTVPMNLREVPLLDTRNVENMVYMFYGCHKLVTVPEYATGKVTTMQHMFAKCTNLVEVPLFDTTAVATMSYMFLECENLAAVPKFDTSVVTNMCCMFSSCKSLTSVPCFNTRSVTNMSNMFSGCISLESVPEFNTVSVTTMRGMFELCSSIETVPLFNTANVTDMSYMFDMQSAGLEYREPKLKVIPEFNTSNVKSFSYFADSCCNLVALPAFDTSSAESADGMFINNKTGLKRPTAITSIPLYDWSSLSGDAGVIFAGLTKVESGMLANYQALNENSNITAHANVFQWCGIDETGTYASSQAQMERSYIPATWGGDMQLESNESSGSDMPMAAPAMSSAAALSESSHPSSDEVQYDDSEIEIPLTDGEYHGRLG